MTKALWVEPEQACKELAAIMSTNCSLEFPDCERKDYKLEPFGDISGLGVSYF